MYLVFSNTGTGGKSLWVHLAKTQQHSDYFRQSPTFPLRSSFAMLHLGFLVLFLERLEKRMFFNKSYPMSLEELCEMF